MSGAYIIFLLVLLLQGGRKEKKRQKATHYGGLEVLERRPLGIQSLQRQESEEEKR